MFGASSPKSTLEDKTSTKSESAKESEHPEADRFQACERKTLGILNLQPLEAAVDLH